MIFTLNGDQLINDRWRASEYEILWMLIRKKVTNRCYLLIARGLAQAEGDASLWEGGEERSPETHYQLSGIVVHSGQASGGHYYSYVLLRYL